MQVAKKSDAIGSCSRSTLQLLADSFECEEEDEWVNIDSDEAMEAVYALAPALSAAVGKGASMDSPIFYALARLLGLLVTEEEEDGYTPFSPAGDVVEVDNADTVEHLSTESAAAAAAAATMAAAAQRALAESQRRLRALCTEAEAAANEAKAQREHARSAVARHEILTEQLNATKKAIDELLSEESQVSCAMRTRRAELLAEEQGLRSLEHIILTEREAASRALRAAMERATSAQSRVDEMRKMSGDSAECWDEQLREAQAEAQAATNALVSVQIIEASREEGRASRLQDAQRVMASNKDLGQMDEEAAQARVEAIAYRRAGLESHASVLQAQLIKAERELHDARPAAVTAATRAERLAAAVEKHREAIMIEKKGAKLLMLKATAATEQSLRTMSMQDDESGSAYDEFAGRTPVDDCIEPGAMERLRLAEAQALHWRKRAEELEFMQDVVIVNVAASRGTTDCVDGALQEECCPNGLPHALDATAKKHQWAVVAKVGATRLAWLSATTQLAKRVREGRLGKAQLRALLNVLRAAAAMDSSTDQRPAASIGVRAAVVGGGLGLAAFGPIGGTALASAAGAVAYAAARRVEAADSTGAGVRDQIDQSDEDNEEGVKVDLDIEESPRSHLATCEESPQCEEETLSAISHDGGAGDDLHACCLQRPMEPAGDNDVDLHKLSDLGRQSDYAVDGDSAVSPMRRSLPQDGGTKACTAPSEEILPWLDHSMMGTQALVKQHDVVQFHIRIISNARMPQVGSISDRAHELGSRAYSSSNAALTSEAIVRVPGSNFEHDFAADSEGADLQVEAIVRFL